MADKNIVEEYVVKLSADTEGADKGFDEVIDGTEKVLQAFKKQQNALKNLTKQITAYVDSMKDIKNIGDEISSSNLDKSPFTDTNTGKQKKAINLIKEYQKSLASIPGYAEQARLALAKIKAPVFNSTGSKILPEVSPEKYMELKRQMEEAMFLEAGNVSDDVIKKGLEAYARAMDTQRIMNIPIHRWDDNVSYDDSEDEYIESSAKSTSQTVADTVKSTVKPVIESIRDDISDANAEAANMGKSLSSASVNKTVKEIPEVMRESVRETSMFRNMLTTLTFPNLRKHVGYFSSDADKLRKKIAKLQADMEKMSNTKMESDDYRFLQNEIDKVTNKLADYEARLDKLKATGGGLKHTASAFRSIRYDIEMSKRELRELNAAMADLKAEGGMYTTGASTPKYAKMQSQLKELQAGLAEVENSGVTVARQIATNIGNSLKNGIGNGVKAGVQIARAGFTNLGKALQTIRKQFVAVNKQIPTMADRFEALKKSMRDLVRFGGMWMQFTIIMTVFNEAKANIDNLAKTFDSFNDALSRIINSVRTFGAQMAAAFEPLVTVAAPYVEAFVDALTRGMDTISQFTARLTGNNLYTKASKGNYDYAASLEESEKKANDATEAVEEYQNTVLGFDQLNKLNGRNTSVDIGLDDALSDPQLNKVETQATKLNSIADKIHDAFAAGDYKGAGKAVAEAVNEAFSWLKNVAGWEANCERITKALRGVIDFINGFAVAFNGYGAGNAIGDVVNSIIHSLNLLTDPENGIDFALIGRRVGEMIKGFVDEVDWYTLGETVIQSIQAMINYINGIITVPGFWTSIGTAIKDGLQGAIDAYKPEDVANLVVNLVNGIATMLSTAFGATGEDNLGVQIGSKLAETVNRIFAGLEPDQIADGVNAFVNTIVSTINTFIAEVDWSQVMSTLAQTLTQLDWGSIIELVALAALPKIPGILGGLIKKAFSGFSLTSLFAGIGGGSGSGGLLSKLGTKIFGGTSLSSITSAASKAGSTIASTFGKAIGSINPITAAIMLTVGTYAITHFEDFKKDILGVVNTLKDNLGQIWDSIGVAFSNAFEGITSQFPGIKANFEQLKQTFSDFINSPPVSGLLNILSFIGEFLVKFVVPQIKVAIDTIGTLLSTGLEFVGTVIGSIGQIIGSAIENVLGLVNGLVDVITGIFTLDLEQIVGGLKEMGTSILDFFSDTFDALWDVIVGWADAMVDSIVGVFESITGAIADFTSWILEKWEDIKSFFTGEKSGATTKRGSGSSHARTASYAQTMSISSIPKLATGGIVGDGQLFIANEGKPELVGSQDGKSVVMNNAQIVDAVSTGVRQAVTEAMLMMRDNNNGGNDGDIVIMVDSEELARASMRGQKKLDRRNNPTVSFA